MNYLILPGIGNSDESHWQSSWERTNRSFHRVAQENWNNPEFDRWMDSLEKAAFISGPNTVVVAHSLGCLLLAHWAFSTKLTIQGALLVAPPNPRSPAFPKEANSFSDFPLQKFNFKSTVVASSDDPYADIKFSNECADNWGSEFICIGAAGHINGNSNLLDWPDGKVILQNLLKTIEAHNQQ